PVFGEGGRAKRGRVGSSGMGRVARKTPPCPPRRRGGIRKCRVACASPHRGQHRQARTDMRNPMSCAGFARGAHGFAAEKLMNPKNLPTIDARYWTAILAASMCGANTGDFASRILGLGHTRGLLPFALIFGLILWAERRSRKATELYYWLAIIVLRTAATNL